MRQQRLVAADWSKHAAKRWYCVAMPDGTGYVADGPFPVGEDFLARWQDSPTLVGVDFAIGLPAAYCERAGVDAFPASLPRFDDAFYTVTNAPSLAQPFYPQSSTGKRAVLEAVVGDPYRECDRITKACPLFWTLGAQQVGRATLHGWREMLRGREARWKLWPFDGEAGELEFGVAEVYPRLAYGGVLGPGRFRKADRASRAAQAGSIRAFAHSRGVRLTERLAAEVDGGFASDDAFDSCVAVLGMTAWMATKVEAPRRESVRRWEGWILGLEASE